MKPWAIAILFVALAFGLRGPADGAEAAAGFSLAILPASGPPGTADAARMEKHLHWMTEHRQEHGIQLAIRVGNITSENRPEEWAAAAAARDELAAAGVSSLFVAGTRDMVREGPLRDLGEYARAFPPDSAHEPQHASKDAFHRAGHRVARFAVGGVRYLLIGLALDPDKDALCRAGAIIQDHRDRRVILVTPRYVADDGALAGGEDASIPTTAGAVIWEELVRRHSNICMVICAEAGGDRAAIRERATGLAADPAAVEDPVLELRLADESSSTIPRLLRFDVEKGQVSLVGGSETIELPLDLSRPTHYRYDRCSDLFQDRAVNTTARGQQRRAALAGDALGRFVVAWEDDSRRARGDFEIHARGFHPDGCERFGEIVVNAVPWGAQVAPAVDMAPDGSFVVVWEDGRRQGDVDIYAAGFDASGKRTFGDVRVNKNALGTQRRPSVAIFSDGSFVVAWEDDHDRDHKWDVFAAGFDGYGRRSFSPRRVHAERTGQHFRPDVGTWSRWSSGSFVVVWEEADREGDASAIMASGFDPRGRPMFKDLRVHEREEGQFARPATCVDEDGSFLVAWEAVGASSTTSDVLVSAFDRGGERRFMDRRVNTTDGRHRRPDIALRSRGDFTVVWERAATAPGSHDVCGAGFDEAGASRFEEQVIPWRTSGSQRTPRVDVAEDGSFSTTWMDDSDGNGFYEIRVNRRPRDG